MQSPWGGGVSTSGLGVLGDGLERLAGSLMVGGPGAGGGQYMSQRSAAGTVQGLDILPVSAHRHV